MGKLSNMVAEPVSLPDRLKISARRMRLAGIGLVSKVDGERARLYRQILELGDSYGRDGSLVGQLTRISTGTVHLVLEESQRVFDELVEAGEQALSGGASRPTASRLSTPRAVAKAPAAKPAVVASETSAAPKAKVIPVKPVAAKPAETKPVASKPAASQSVESKPAAIKPVPAKPATKASSAKTASTKAPATKTPSTKAPESPQVAVASDLRQNFEAAKSRVTSLDAAPDQASMLTLYALFKQATEGDVSGRRPGPAKLVERAKFDAWQKLKGMTLVDAMERYIAIVDSLVPV